MSCGVGCRPGSDLVLLRLWPKLAASAPIGLLAWKLPCALGLALKKKKKKRNLLTESQIAMAVCVQSPTQYPLQWVKGSGIATAAT